jgi:hypothetical protein
MRLLPALTACLAALVVAAPATASQGRQLTASDRKAINATLDVFVNHAVKRKDAGAAYGVVTGALRADMTREAWSRGSIPVYPYPARGHRFHEWTVQYVTRDEVAIQLLLMPRPGSKLGPIIFHVYLTPSHGRWLVNSFMPAATLAPLGAKPKVTAITDFMPQAQGEGSSGGPGQLSQVYAIIPFALVGLVLLGLAAWGVAAWVRDRRLTRSAERKLPPLPPHLSNR